MAFVKQSDHKRVEMLPGVNRTMLSCGERVMVVKIDLAKGSVVPTHTHPHEQVGHVASGKLRFWIGDEERVLEANEGYAIPAYVAHGCEALEETVAIDTFNPPREEYR